MREIKFRGKRVDNEEWIYGSLLLINDKAYIYPLQYGDLNDVNFGESFAEVIPKTVGQLTGLKDKNGKEIYEGDIVKYPSTSERFDYIWVVVFKDGAFKLEYKDVCYALLAIWAEDIEVIGNIYDNFKFLEEE